MIVYGNTLSPYVRKTMAFAAEKGIEVQLVQAGMGQGPHEFRIASPFGKMPGFQDGDFFLADSTAIITYLDALKADPALIPAAPKERAKAIWYEEFTDTILIDVMGRIFFNRFVAPRVLGREGDLAAAEKAEKEELPPLIHYVEGVLPESGYLVGDRLTLADIAVASPFVNLDHLGISVDGAQFPKTRAFLDRMWDRPSYAGMLAAERGMFGR